MCRILAWQSSYKKLQLEQLVGKKFQGKESRTQMAPGAGSGCGHCGGSFHFSYIMLIL